MSFVGNPLASERNGPKSPLMLGGKKVSEEANAVIPVQKLTSDRFENEEFLEIEE